MSKEDLQERPSLLAIMCKALVHSMVDNYKKQGYTALPLDVSQCSIHRYGPDDEDVFQKVVLTTGYDFSNISGLNVDTHNTQTLRDSSGSAVWNINVVPVILTPKNSDKIRLIFAYVHQEECPLTRWTLVNSRDQVITIVPTKCVSTDDEVAYFMRIYNCAPEQVRSYERAVSRMRANIHPLQEVLVIEGEEDVEPASRMMLSAVNDVDTFCKKLSTEQWCRCLAFNPEHEPITLLCHRTAEKLLGELAQASNLGDALNNFPLTQALRFIPDHESNNGRLLGFALWFDFDRIGSDHLLDMFRRTLPAWGAKTRPVLPLEQWTTFFKPIPNSWEKFELALASVLEQHFMTLLQKLQEEHVEKVVLHPEPEVHQMGKRARRSARKRGEMSKAPATLGTQCDSAGRDLGTKTDSEHGASCQDPPAADVVKAPSPVVDQEGDDSSTCGGSKLDLTCLPEELCSERNTKLASSPVSASTRDSNCSELSASDSDSESRCVSIPESSHPWHGKCDHFSSFGSAAEVVACYENDLGPHWHVMCAVVKNTFLEPVNVYAQEARAMLRRTKSCGALSLESV